MIGGLVLIVQDDHLTASALSTVMVVPLTTNLRRATDKTFLDAPTRRLPARIMRSVDARLRLALTLRVK